MLLRFVSLLSSGVMWEEQPESKRILPWLWDAENAASYSSAISEKSNVRSFHPSNEKSSEGEVDGISIAAQEDSGISSIVDEDAISMFFGFLQLLESLGFILLLFCPLADLPSFA